MNTGQIIGDRNEWPLYLTDEGIVRCRKDNCDAAIGDYVRGRRITYLEFEMALFHHALVDHNTLL